MKKKIKSITSWLFFNGLMWWAMYLTFIKGNQNAGNVIMFIQWFTFVMSFSVIMCYALDDKFKEKMKDKLTNTPKILHHINDISMFLIFAYYGWFCIAIITAIAWQIQNELFFNKN